MSASRIALMPEELANQIAAGEVVERPASVVKELVENSLDAGAQRIEVEVEGGGLTLIRITDDGSGMSPEDAELCLLRHATSKLRCADDLFRLETMGFRGEAMASIASVSRLTLTTRTRDAVAAHRLTLEGGQKVAPSREVGAPVGTQIEVRDLFYNVPARLKFMKAEATELGHVVETLVRLALAFPGVHVRLRSKGKVTLDLPPHRSGLERSRAALASRGKSGGPPPMYMAEAVADGMRVEAHIGSPEDSTSTPRNVFLLVNRRFVRDRSLLHAATSGFGELLERGRYPLLVLQLHLDAATVDVNVHPQKLEVRMAQADAVYGLVRQAIRNTAAQAPWLLGVSPPARVYTIGAAAAGGGGSTVAREATPSYGMRGEPGSVPPSGLPVVLESPGAMTGGLRDPASVPVHLQPAFSSPASGRPQAPAGNPQLALQPQWSAPTSGLAEHRARLEQALKLYAPPGAATEPPAAPPEPDQPPAPLGAPVVVGTDTSQPTPATEPGHDTPGRIALASMGFLGQLLRTYLVCEQGEELILVDQHAAHERVVFERLRRAHAEKPLQSQRLLFPISMELDPRRAALIDEHTAALERLGFEVRPFSGRSFALVAAPDLGAYGRGAQVHRDPERLLAQVLDELDEHGRSDALGARLDLLLATMACHAAVRAGDLLDPTQARALLAAMDEVDYSPHCPHGRPVLVRLPRAEIERRFGRA